MESQFGLTPFGSQRMTHALLAVHQKAREIPQGAAADKWQLHRWLCEGKNIIGISDRSLAVLSALLSFYPENTLVETGALVVFPSNKQLALRAHGMADATLRRHLAALVEAGIITRQDSPNGKRYARRSKSGELKVAFGFSLAPLLARAVEFEAAAEQVKSEKIALREIREQLTLLRRDISKLLDYAIEASLVGPWDELKVEFRAVVDSIPRRAEMLELTTLLAKLHEIRGSVDKALNNNQKVQNLSDNESQNERQLNESKPDSHFDRNVTKSDTVAITTITDCAINAGISLDMVLRACPEISTYASGPISQWEHLMATAEKVRSFIGIDTKLYEMALKMLGRQNTAITIAYLLQRYNDIRSVSGYLRILTEKAAEDAFSVKALMVSALHIQQRQLQ
ncbi:plasmid replication protein RepC [Ochrobactrum quorumnocens]|jgi:replication initiation protein RepC|uniref:Replication initiation protein RepC n=1 Tax=Ochrobactrum quorumnocens TaxID=271865 RepID=A0A5N1K3W4_9HYPH|nr:plasmid replication protein RepC [[Ochrobactrum] quorumnocens]KAA9371107.1 replication initiation protein RepC [[Ochrobactrum] quorumnocens]